MTIPAHGASHDDQHGKDAHPKGDHGTSRSYVIGFILSLVFTAIPYWLVADKVIAGTILLVIILGFAALQMIVQVVFFLHLGRERGPRWQLYFFVGTVFGILTVVVGSILIMSHLHKNMTPTVASKYLAEKEGISQLGGEKTGACKGRQESHKVIIRDGKATPGITIAHHCDSLIFINEDPEVRLITFGTHPDHGSYSGETELIVRKGRSKSIVLNESGSFRFHDHLSPDINGYFTVTP